MKNEYTVSLNKAGSLVRAGSPEEVGISSAAVEKMLSHLENSGFQYHSLMLVRNGKVAAECYRAPFSAESAHTMYSVSKSVTATAVGFAVSEGLLTLDTKIASIFPEYRKSSDKTGYFDKMTVRHLLSMTSGKLPSVLLNKTDDDWLSHLFNSKWISEPGTKFDYVNENMYALCAVLRRVTGMSVTDYLMPRLFAPLGIERPFWETDGHGTEAGGWGLFLKTEDLAKLMLLYHCGGMWNKKRVLPEAWVLSATSNQHGDNPGTRENGYGYGIWVRNSNEYYAGGMFTQMSYIFEKEDCAAVVTACSPSEVPFYEALEILQKEGFIEPKKGVKASDAFKNMLSSKKIDSDLLPVKRSPAECDLNGKMMHFRNDFKLNAIGFPPGVLHLAAVYMSKYRAGNINNVSLFFSENELSFSWSENDETNCIRCGMNGEYLFSPMVLAHTKYTAAATAFWESEQLLNVWIRPVESLCCRKLKFNFKKDGSVTLHFGSSPDTDEIVKSVSDEIRNMMPGQRLNFLADKAIDYIKKTVEPTLYGKVQK